MSWVHDHCDDDHISAINERRARGILALHAACEPPCPRKVTAMEYLATLPVAEVLYLAGRASSPHGIGHSSVVPR